MSDNTQTVRLLVEAEVEIFMPVQSTVKEYLAGRYRLGLASLLSESGGGLYVLADHINAETKKMLDGHLEAGRTIGFAFVTYPVKATFDSWLTKQSEWELLMVSDDDEQDWDQVYFLAR